MEKKELKFYEAPEMEIIETQLEGFLCASGGDDIDPGNDDEIDL